MRPSRSIAVIALVAMVLMRGVGFAAEAWTANAVECCCGRHAIDHDCGCPMCPSHHRGARHDDHTSHLRSCAHHVQLAVTSAPPPVVTATPPLDRAAPRALAPRPPPLPSFESRVVHPVTPPS